MTLKASDFGYDDETINPIDVGFNPHIYPEHKSKRFNIRYISGVYSRYRHDILIRQSKQHTKLKLIRSLVRIHEETL